MSKGREGKGEEARVVDASRCVVGNGGDGGW